MTLPPEELEFLDAMMASARKLDRQATLDCIDALARWTRHLPGCGVAPCECGLAVILAALKQERQP